MKRIGRLATLTIAACGLAVGAGVLTAVVGGGAAASASPTDSSHSSVSSPSASSARSSAPDRTPRATQSGGSGATVRPITATPRVTAVAQRRASAPRTASRALPTLPTPTDVAQAIQTTLATLGRELTRLPGTRLIPTATVEATPTAKSPLRDPPDPGDVVYGNPVQNVKYWIYQGNNNTCVLSSTAMVIGQLKGEDGMPTWAEIVQDARDTPSYLPARGQGSVWKDLQKRWVPRTGNIYDPLGDEYVYYVDSMQLFEKHGVDATMTTYTSSQGDLALANLKAALNTSSVFVPVNNVIWAEAIGGAHTPRRFGLANHAITVLGINETKDVIYINDSGGTGGKGLAVPLDKFMEAWQRGQYLTMSAQLAASSTPSAIAA
ncbi:hypothetical protein [Mycobacterium sp. shizuoka-1]|uniref:hypothetical protein n=1 Tax=Mycobacterium sp. shizuoka-1 TaxID=2039281 RepID=UPI000C05F79C|nr:hypothetical protein [Mycobacterium sp. shizuoka-1]GAY14145.1 hypothetical protein MSZK_08710 [Mycobacterium sp. shizuoka-1]